MIRIPRPSLLFPILVASVAAAADYVPLPSACEILEAIDARALAGIDASAGEMIELPLEERDGVRLSSCSLPTPGIFGYGLTLREETAAPSRSAPEQVEELLRQYAEVWGEEATAEPVDAGEAAVWIAEMHQLWVIARDGHAYLIVSMPEDADAAAAAAFANRILAGFD